MTTTPTIECRIPDGAWAKTVTEVEPRAKTGYDWTGDFLRAGQLIDLEPGEVLTVARNTGSRKHPSIEVTIYILMPNAEWASVVSYDGKEWASSLRKEARELLDLEPERRIKKVAAAQVTIWETKLAARIEKRAVIAKALETAEADATAMYNNPPSGYNYFHFPLAASTSQGTMHKRNTAEEFAAAAKAKVEGQLSVSDERIAEARARIAEYEKLAKGKKGDVTVAMIGELGDELKQALAELLTVCGTQEKIVEVLTDGGVRRAVRRALKAEAEPAAAVAAEVK